MFFSSCLHYYFWNIDASECVHVELLIFVRFLVRLPFLWEGVLIESGSSQLFVTLRFRVLVNSLGFSFRLIFIMLVDCLLKFFSFSSLPLSVIKDWYRFRSTLEYGNGRVLLLKLYRSFSLLFSFFVSVHLLCIISEGDFSLVLNDLLWIDMSLLGLCWNGKDNYRWFWPTRILFSTWFNFFTTIWKLRFKIEWIHFKMIDTEEELIKKGNK